MLVTRSSPADASGAITESHPREYIPTRYLWLAATFGFYSARETILL